MDTLGLVLQGLVNSTAVQDRDGAKLLFQAFVDRMDGWCRLQLIWADGGYAGKLVAWVQRVCHWVLAIVKRSDDVKGVVVLPTAGLWSTPLAG